MVKYNAFNNRIIECIGTDPATYNASNWNYLFLVNFIDRFMSNTNLIYDTEELKKTKQAILDAKKDNGYMCDYDKYNTQIERAYNNIKKYCEELDLIAYLDELRKARLMQIRPKKSI